MKGFKSWTFWLFKQPNGARSCIFTQLGCFPWHQNVLKCDSSDHTWGKSTCSISKKKLQTASTNSSSAKPVSSPTSSSTTSPANSNTKHLNHINAKNAKNAVIRTNNNKTAVINAKNGLTTTPGNRKSSAGGANAASSGLVRPGLTRRTKSMLLLSSSTASGSETAGPPHATQGQARCRQQRSVTPSRPLIQRAGSDLSSRSSARTTALHGRKGICNKAVSNRGQSQNGIIQFCKNEGESSMRPKILYIFLIGVTEFIKFTAAMQNGFKMDKISCYLMRLNWMNYVIFDC